MWITLAATCHELRDKTYLQKQLNITMMITLFSLIICHSHRCFQNYIYIFLTETLPTCFQYCYHLKFSRKFHYNYHGDCRILADGMLIWHLECCYCLTSILGRRSWPDYPRHSLRMCLHNLHLDTHQPYTTSTSWRCFIWTFCHCIECSIYPAVVTGRWGLWEWVQHSWLTNTFAENPSYTPHV